MRLRPGVPVLARGPDSAQVGLSRPLVLGDLTRAQMAWLATLESGMPPAEHDIQRHQELWETLRRHGVLCADAPGPGGPAPATQVRIHHAGPLALALARTLAHGGVTSLVLADAAPASVEAPGTYAPGAPGVSCAAAAAWTLRDEVPHLRWADADGDVDIEVIIAMASAPPTLTAPMMARDRLHLLMLTDEEGVSVGPLVRPGHTACALCLDLHRTSAEPSWPRLAVQCAHGRRPWVEPGLVDLAAALAAREILTALHDHDVPAETGHRAPPGRQWRVPREDHRLEGLVPSPVPPHPECGCGAAGPPGDEVGARRARFSVVDGGPSGPQ